MAKYIVKEESLIDKLVGAVFGSVAKQAKSKAIKDLSSKDPEFAKKVKELEKSRKDMESYIKKKIKNNFKKDIQEFLDFNTNHLGR